jgi:hypothetical protein
MDFDRVSETIAAYLLRSTAGLDRGRAGAWVITAPRLGAPVLARYAPGESKGCYIRTDAGDVCIVLNCAYPEDVRREVLIHELAHHIMAENDPALQKDYETYFDGRGRNRLHHEIALRVQDLIRCPEKHMRLVNIA